MVRHLPTDPTAPREPIRLPRDRPGAVTIAGVIMMGGAALGFLNAVATIVASATIGAEFRTRAAEHAGVALSEVDHVAASVQALFFFAGMVGAAFALVIVALAVGVLRGNLAARLGATVMVALSLLCVLAGNLGTVGASRGATFIVTLNEVEVDLGGPLSKAIPSWLASLTSGLGCLQGLGYIAVVMLVFVPASNAYFRRRPPSAVDPLGQGARPTP